MTEYERFILPNEIPFENKKKICLPIRYGAGRLFYSFPKKQTQKINLIAIEKDSNIYRLDYMPYPLPKGEADAGFLDFHEEIQKIEKEINDIIVRRAKVSDETFADARREVEGFLYRLKNNRSNGKPHMYLTLKAICELNAPARISVESAIEVFLGNESIGGLVTKYENLNRFSSAFQLNIALYTLYSEEIEKLNLSQKEKAIAEALYDKKDVTVKFSIDGKGATGHYTTEQVMAAYAEGFPAPAPKGLDWDSIVEIYSGKKELCVYRDAKTKEEERKER